MNMSVAVRVELDYDGPVVDRVVLEEHSIQVIGLRL